MGKRSATEVFSDWARFGKDEGMERGHAPSVNEMLNLALPKVAENFSALDLGCGNGWVVRLLSKQGANYCQGIDGSVEMIKKAKRIDPEGNYSFGVIPGWNPERKFDLIHSMEFLYYLEKPEEILTQIRNEWLNEGGILVAGIDHYLENEDSLSWPEHVGVHMTTYSIVEWKSHMMNAGFSNVEIHQVAGSEKFPGTLVMLGQV